MPLSASVFRRGGPKKELFDVINEDADDEKELEEKLAELDELLHLDKTGRELSAALWRPSFCAAELVKQRKQCARDMGFIRGHRTYLQVEEAVFLLDRGDLLLFVEEPDDQRQQQQQALGAVADAAGDGVAAAGPGERRRHQRQRLLSVQEAFDLMISVGVPLERYQLYSSLSRSGYLVMRHPSRWLLGREEQPEQVWGNGAWAACYGRTPAVPGAVPPQPMQQQLAAAYAATATVTGDASTPMEIDSRDSAAAAVAVAAAATERPQESGVKQQPPQPQQRLPPQRWRRPATGADSASSLPASSSAGCRGWWREAGPEHPHLQGVPEGYFRQLPPGVVVDRLSASLRTSFPNLQPLEPIRSVLAAPTAAAAATNAAPRSGAAVVGADGGASRSCGGIFLGIPSTCALLVFDVYKPGSFVSRYKGQLPAVQTHVAMCSAAPPKLGEMRAADTVAAAAAVVVTPGEAVRPASVTWATVLNGDVALFSFGEADLLCLL